MSVQPQNHLRFLGVDFPIVNLAAKGNNVVQDDSEVVVNIVPKVLYPKENSDIFRIFEEVNISVKDKFELNIVAVGTFEVGKDTKDEVKNHFVNVNAPAIMFPYVRSFISTLTSNIGNISGTLTIPPQQFKGEIEVIPEEDIFEVKPD